MHTRAKGRNGQSFSRFPQCEACPGVLLLPPDRMLFHRRVTPSSMSPVPIYTPGWRESKWIRVTCIRKQCNRRGLNTRPPDPEFEVLTIRPHTSPLRKKIITNFALDIVYDQALQSIYIYMTFYINIIIIILVWTNGQTCKDSRDNNQCFSYSRQSNQYHHPVSFLS